VTAAGASQLDAVDTSTPVLIFGLSRGAFHHGALGIARSAGRLGIPVHRLCRERTAPAAHSRYGHSWRYIPADATSEEILEMLEEYHRDIGTAVLVPIDDVSSVFVDEHAAALADAFLFPRQPTGLAHSLSSKREMHEICQTHSIPTPAASFPQSESDVLALASDVDYPTVLKCINAADSPPTAPRVAIAEDATELLARYREMSASRPDNVMLQQYIPGTPEAVWMFNGYFDESSECRVGFTGRKVRQSPPYTGVTTLGVCATNATVKETTVRLMKAVGYRGVLDIGYRYDERDGEYKLLDVNPRIGGTFRLFVAGDGMDVMRALYLDLTGQQIHPSSAQDGRRWVVEPTDFASSLVYLRRGDISFARWARSFRGVREAAWFARDDPRPFLALWVRLVFDELPRRALRRARRL
jgi:D-aspartate ligase